MFCSDVSVWLHGAPKGYLRVRVAICEIRLDFTGCVCPGTNMSRAVTDRLMQLVRGRAGGLGTSAVGGAWRMGNMWRFGQCLPSLTFSRVEPRGTGAVRFRAVKGEPQTLNPKPETRDPKPYTPPP